MAFTFDDSLAGKAGGFLNSFFGGGAGQSAQPQPTNPNNLLLNQLFGTKTITHGHGSDAGLTEVVRNKKNPGIFGGPEFQNSIKNFAFNAPGLTAGEQGITNSLLGPGNNGQQRLDQTLSGLDSLIGGNQQLTQGGQGAQIGGGLLDNGFAASVDQGLLGNGYQQSAQPAYDTAISQFQRNILPAIAERLGVTGGGVQSQGFIDTGGREAANLLDSAAQQQIGLNESAAARRSQAQLAQSGFQDSANARRANALTAQAGFDDSALDRRLGATGLQNQLLNTRLAVPTAFANDQFALGNQQRSVINEQARRPLDVFAQLSGLGAPSQQGFTQQGFDPQGSGTADLLGSLATSLPAFLQIAGLAL